MYDKTHVTIKKTNKMIFQSAYSNSGSQMAGAHRGRTGVQWEPTLDRVPLSQGALTPIRMHTGTT